MRVLLVGIVLIAAILAVQAAPQAETDDVHIHVVKTADNSVKASETLAGIEAKFVNGHEKVMKRLNKALRKITKHVDGHKSVEFVEVGGIVIPTIDGTGSIPQGAPKANLTRFTVKPVVDATLVQDAKLIRQPKKVALIELAGEGDADSETDTTASVDVDAEVDAAIDDTAEAESEVDVDAEVDQAIDATADAEAGADVEAEVESAVDAEMTTETATEASTMAELEDQAQAESQSEADALANAEAEAEADVAVDVEVSDMAEIEIAPIIDGTGTDSHTPKANLTRFTVKPTIDATLALDAKLAKPAGVSFLEMGKQIYPILDNTGTDSFTPKANLTRFSVKPTIDNNLFLDAALNPSAPPPQPVQTNPILPPIVPAPIASAPSAPKSLLEIQNCPGCKNRGVKQNLEIVLSPQTPPGSIDAPLFEELHRRVDYLLEPVAKSLDIKQSSLESARTSILNAAEAHERFADFKEKQANQKLIPQYIQDEQKIVQL